MPTAADTIVLRLRELKAYVYGDDVRRRTMRRERLLELVSRRLTRMLVVEDDGLRYLIDTQDPSEITRRIFTWGRYEEPLMARGVRTLAAATGVAEPLAGKAFLDVGANIGSASMVAVRRFGAQRALALEPGPENVRLLKANLALNDLDGRVEPIAAAVSDTPGAVVLELAPENIGDHRVRMASEVAPAMGEAQRATLTVPAVRLDDVVAERGLQATDIGLVWVDVQGHEAQVLAGMPKLLAGGVPLVVEYWPYGLRRAGALTRFHNIVTGTFARAWTLGTEHDDEAPAELPVADIAGLPDRLTGEDAVTNLLLVPRPAA
jgi:FkbM family methyltransferase